MYTLTTSPAASPRAAFHIPSDTHRQHYTSTSATTSPSPQASAHSSSTHSPRVFARPSAHSFTTSSPRTRASNARAAAPNSPSTSQQPRRHSSQVSLGKEERLRFVDVGTQYSPEGYPPTAFSRERKRKEAARSPREQIIAHMAASAVTSQPPAEPRADSSRAQAAEPEPQEARSTAVGATKRQKAEPGKVKIMPRAYETCDPKDLGVLIANMLMELIRLNDQIPLRDGRLTRFHSRAPPGISVSDYLQRLIQHATLSPPILLSMVYYIDRLCQLYSAFTINSLTVHRFLITAATVAAKGLSDSFWTNPTYARIGGIPISELATLELEFLQKVQWKIVPKPETLVDYYNSLVDRTDGFELEPGQSGSESSEISPDESETRDQDVLMSLER